MPAPLSPEQRTTFKLEAGNGFIGQKQTSILGQGTGDRATLLLPSG